MREMIATKLERGFMGDTDYKSWADEWGHLTVKEAIKLNKIVSLGGEE